MRHRRFACPMAFSIAPIAASGSPALLSTTPSVIQHSGLVPSSLVLDCADRMASATLRFPRIGAG